ncbi:unnamed protein product [Adineta ricciae]|uniref:Uncharacterized protein n=1 Tax=Adineta ricciae TaxID=249248 RepID=A0A815BKD6_ADIRI|nr:unnamed protein product [Adineta ricciae]CAF1402268.1 unnamed protein product [Adineta ricciae]
MNTPHSASNLRRKIKTFVRDLNLFPSIPPSTDEHQLYNQRISTRLFLFCLIVSLTILLVYNSVITITQTVIVLSPTITQYSQLYEKYPQTLTCPCSKISIDYGTFFRIEYTFHPVCYSDFVTDNWIDYLSV